LVLGVHLFAVIVPLAANCFAGAQVQNFVPWIALLFGVGVWVWRHKLTAKKYAEFLENSPGRQIDTTDIKYGIGHPAHDDKI
jgi:hypothetical protein